MLVWEKVILSLWTWRAAGCRDCEGTRTCAGDLGQVWRTVRPPNLREDAFAILLLFSTHYPVWRIPSGFWAIPLFPEIPKNLDSFLQPPDAAVTSSEVSKNLQHTELCNTTGSPHFRRVTFWWYTNLWGRIFTAINICCWLLFWLSRWSPNSFF